MEPQRSQSNHLWVLSPRSIEWRHEPNWPVEDPTQRNTQKHPQYEVWSCKIAVITTPVHGLSPHNDPNASHCLWQYIRWPVICFKGSRTPMPDCTHPCCISTLRHCISTFATPGWVFGGITFEPLQGLGLNQWHRCCPDRPPILVHKKILWPRGS